MTQILYVEERPRNNYINGTDDAEKNDGGLCRRARAVRSRRPQEQSARSGKEPNPSHYGIIEQARIP